MPTRPACTWARATVASTTAPVDEKAYLVAVPGVGAPVRPVLLRAHRRAPAARPVPRRPEHLPLRHRSAADQAGGADLPRPDGREGGDSGQRRAVGAPVVADGRSSGGFVRECIQRPCPTSIDFLEPGMFVVNYRNEPVGLRVYDPNQAGPDGKNGAQADGCGRRSGVSPSIPYRPSPIPALNVMPAQGAIASPPAAAITGAFPVAAANIAATEFPPHINIAGFGARRPLHADAAYLLRRPCPHQGAGGRRRGRAQRLGAWHEVAQDGFRFRPRSRTRAGSTSPSGGISEQFAVRLAGFHGLQPDAAAPPTTST